MGKIIGIDLGTTYSSVAYVNQHGKPEILSNREGERITPSVVLFDDDVPIVGSIAKRSAIASPLNVVQFIKRQIGNSSWKFRTENGEAYNPEEISAIILKRLKEDAENLLGEKVTDVVITVPAYFDDSQRKSTQDAGRIAGLNVVRVINEPTAAALAYGLEKRQPDQTVLVYDLGGGTFDVTILRLNSGNIEVLATGGDKNLGGFDWDNEIMNYVNEYFINEGGVDLFDDPTFEQDLRDKAEMAKKTLSTRDKTKIFISAGGKNLSIPLDQEHFHNITESLLKRTANIMKFVLEDANLEWKDIDKVLMVGGSTRMKAVPALIEELTGLKPSLEVHPDEVVSMGAALQGAIIQIEEGSSDIVEQAALSLVEIKDVNSHSMGIVAVDDQGHDFNAIVLNKDTTIPCTVSDTFQTIVDNQTELHVRVTEGEDRDLNYVKIVGEGTMKIPQYPKGAPIEVTFKYDHDGIIHVTVEDTTSKTHLGELKINRISNLIDEEVENSIQKVSCMTVN